MAASTLSDPALVAAFRSGGEDAFAEIVRRHRPRLLAYARSVLGSAADAEDVVQDAFVSAYGALRRDGRPMALLAWLRRIVLNRALDHLGRRRDAPLSDDVAGAASTAEIVMARLELRDAVGALSSLPDRQRRALTLRVFDGRSYHAIGEELDASPQATKALIARARAAVRPALAQPA